MRRKRKQAAFKKNKRSFLFRNNSLVHDRPSVIKGTTYRFTNKALPDWTWAQTTALTLRLDIKGNACSIATMRSTSPRVVFVLSSLSLGTEISFQLSFSAVCVRQRPMTWCVGAIHFLRVTNNCPFSHKGLPFQTTSAIFRTVSANTGKSWHSPIKHNISQSDMKWRKIQLRDELTFDMIF